MWKISVCDKAKASLDVCQVGCGENQLDRMPKDLERAKRNFEVCRAECRKKSSDDCHAIEKNEEQEKRRNGTCSIL